MAQIGILTCPNCTQDTNCASVVCLGDMRKGKAENKKGYLNSFLGNCLGFCKDSDRITGYTRYCLFQAQEQSFPLIAAIR